MGRKAKVAYLPDNCMRRGCEKPLSRFFYIYYIRDYRHRKDIFLPCCERCYMVMVSRNRDYENWYKFDREEWADIDTGYDYIKAKWLLDETRRDLKMQPS